MFVPKKSHEVALKRIGHYLIGTRDKGLIISPTSTLNIDADPDADFAGLYGYEDNNDPVCVKSRTGYVINVAGCPVYWSSKLQMQTALSTMEAKVIAMSNMCCKLFPIIHHVKLVGSSVRLKQMLSPKLHLGQSMKITPVL